MSVHSDMVNHVYEIEQATEIFDSLDVLYQSATTNRTIRPCQLAAIVQVREMASNLIEILAPQCPFSQNRTVNNCCEQIAREFNRENL
ncbi:hypothetical protein HMPREF0044_0118 [Gleimia coleocanis DSM 15436]|uniref:Uncharacterized protein n=1 Tax=Gleimia coleocanis DSM 15436 TaxID=525245 RepID=C0VY78_9ACTO|nr:hypothetical protein [Gleimia coleocanis]EEH64381.1 hypothetical protein HMPREF0044_0118 [Gleimia coleocanis DSM 15436]